MLRRMLCMLLAVLLPAAVCCAEQAQPDLAAAMADYLNCPCTYFPAGQDNASFLSAYADARERGAQEGFVPVLVAVDDVLWQRLLMNADESAANDGYDFSAANVARYREEMLAQPLRDSKAVLDALTDAIHAHMESYGLDWEGYIDGEMTRGVVTDRFKGYIDFRDGGGTMPLLLAEIPTENPWEIFAWLPLGNWGACPDTPELMSVAKRWYEQYGAFPAVVSSRALEFAVSSPVPREQAVDLAMEQFGFCPYIVWITDITVGQLADGLRKSTIWSFWWA